MKICKTILGIVCLLLTGCYEENIESLSVVDETATQPNSAYISLNFRTATNTSTRSTDNPPKGGEWGDGREIGQSYENTVSTAAVFLYQDNGGVNGSATTPVTFVYFSGVDGKQNSSDNIDYIATTEAQPVDLELEEHYNVLAIANPGDVSWAQEAGLTLGTVRDHIETVAWTEANGAYSSFLMTSENEGEGVTITADNTRDNPAVAEVDVERMAARVDYQATGTYTINADDGGDTTYEGAKVEITGAAIVNNLTAGSYLLKRVKGGYGEAYPVTYLGEETADANDMATNYVIDPWTDQKDGNTDLSYLYGVYYPGVATDGDEQNPSYWENLVTAGTPITVDGETWNRIGYTMENTTYADYTNKKYNTGAVFAAIFTPAEGTVVDGFYADAGFSYDYANHATFFKWNEVLYATAEDIMAVAYPKVFTIENMFGETTFGDITDMDGLTTFIGTLRDDDPTGYKAYLKTFTTLPTNMNTLYWVNYMENECGYKFDTNNGVTLNAFDVETTYTSTRAALAAYTDEEVSTYEDAQCYYTWWIRHSNDDSDETNGIMEYAIVRNNIYKLQVSSVYSIGGDIPREGLRIHVYVKDWTMITEEVIDL